MTFKAFLHRNSLWLLCVAVSVLIFFLIHLYVPVPPEEVAINMMFNITQSLAAIVTLAISIPLVAAQMSARYSIGALDIVFTRKTVAYFIWLIFSTLYPLLIAGSLTLHASGAAISFMASCIILLIPYFYETKERLKPENLLKDLSDRAKRELQNMLSETILREVEKEINTFPFFPPLMFDLMKIDDVAKNIHDCIMSAYSRSEYDIFKLGLSELNSLVDEVYEKHKLLARFFAGPIDSEITLVPPILKRFQIIGIDVVENTYAFDTVTRTLGSIGVNAIEKNLPELAKLSSVQLSFLGYHVLGRRSSRPFERVIDSLDLVLSSAISGNALELAKSIGERIKMVGGEAINREATTRLLKSIAETFGDWGPEAYSEKSEEVRAEAWKLIIELFIFFSSIAAERGMFEASSFYVEKLFVLGSFARRKKLNEVIAENLKDSPSNGTLQRYRTQIIDKAEKEITKRKENLTYLQSFLSETKL